MTGEAYRIDVSPRSDTEMGFICRTQGWSATGVVTVTAAGPRITGLWLNSHLGEDGLPLAIGSTMLREVPTGSILAAVNTVLAGGRPAYEPGRPGRPVLSQALLQVVAEDYVREAAPGMPSGALGRVSELHGKPLPTISRWVSRARDEGWLLPAAPGSKAVQPGPRLLAARKEVDTSTIEDQP